MISIRSSHASVPTSNFDELLHSIANVGDLSQDAIHNFQAALSSNALPTKVAKSWQTLLRKFQQENLLECFDQSFLSVCGPELLHSGNLLASIDEISSAPKKVLCGLCTCLSGQTSSWSSLEYLKVFDQAAKFGRLFKDQHIWVEPELWLTSHLQSKEEISTLDRCTQKLAGSCWKAVHLTCASFKALIQSLDKREIPTRLEKKLAQI